MNGSALREETWSSPRDRHGRMNMHTHTHTGTDRERHTDVRTLCFVLFFSPAWRPTDRQKKNSESKALTTFRPQCKVVREPTDAAAPRRCDVDFSLLLFQIEMAIKIHQSQSRRSNLLPLLSWINIKVLLCIYMTSVPCCALISTCQDLHASYFIFPTDNVCVCAYVSMCACLWSLHIYWPERRGKSKAKWKAKMEMIRGPNKLPLHD